MKKMILYCFIVALIAGACARNNPTEKTVLGMGSNYYLIPQTFNGKIKELKEINYWAIEKDGQITKGQMMTRKDLDSVGCTPNLIANFNESGILTESKALDGEKVIQGNYATVENGKWTRIEYKSNDTIISYIIPQYDNEGYFTGGTTFRPQVDTILGKFTVSYDTKGNFNRIEYFNNKNKRTGYHVCTHDEMGNITETKYFNMGDSLSWTMSNTYDKSGSMIKQTIISEKPKSISTWEYKDLKLDEHRNATQYFTNADNGKFKIFSERSFIYY